MSIIVKDGSQSLWTHVVQEAEKECAAFVPHELELYLAGLLERYLVNADIANRVLAIAYLEALQHRARERAALLQAVGDECLLFAGFYPSQAEKKGVTTDYFVKLGRTAYQVVSHKTNDLCAMLSSQFVLLADILQTIRREPDLLPLEAYERWQKTGSQRAYKMLLLYTKGVAIK